MLVCPWRTSSTDPNLFEVTAYIKRIIGLGPETLTIINPYDGVEHPQQHDKDGQQTQQVWHIPQGHIFVRGDHGSGSIDSLTWGSLPTQSVLGIVMMKLPPKVRDSFP